MHYLTQYNKAKCKLHEEIVLSVIELANRKPSEQCSRKVQVKLYKIISSRLNVLGVRSAITILLSKRSVFRQSCYVMLT